ncbi:MAG: ABC transporter permease subunit [Candidatus Cloacimonetes bacterium]|nr:ABC transporter permease subunit [Candidatus Cloacimonadota bacterium]
MNQTYDTEYKSFNDIQLPEELPTSGALLVDWAYFVEAIATPDEIFITGVEYDYRSWLKQKYPDIETLNKSYQLGYREFRDIKLSSLYPVDNVFEAGEWEYFLKNVAKPQNISINSRAQIAFQDYLCQRFPDGTGGFNIKEMNRIYGTSYRSLHDVYPSSKIPDNPIYREDWLTFVKEYVPTLFLQVESQLEQDSWNQYLVERYKNIETLNSKWHEAYEDFSQINIDWLTIDYLDFKENKGKIFREHLTRNYVMVLNEMLYNGRAMFNTLIYVSLAIATAVIVNPLAAYALSRFKIASSYKIILILMLTMAFPPMVMGIPNFLILKKLNMLNTFWALILPGLADGYFIFLLKGFFDSLPQELFESATVDGAGEARIFWQIAMQLSKPIMAVIALGAFNAAYRNFMFAFIVCQDKSMWTMMVSIYQLMLRSAPGVGFAALVIAAIPTFLVFIFFQNIIIKGIVVPTEK